MSYTNKILVNPSSSSPLQSEQSKQSEQSQDIEESGDEEPSSSVDEPLEYASDSITSSQHIIPHKRSSKDDLNPHFSPLNEFFPTEPSSSTRPNKYHGPPSTWRSWTAAERELAASLNQLDAKDLALHLFNVFALKRRAGRLRRRRAQSTRENDNINREQEWVPPRIWTAWPLTPDVVPRQKSNLHWKADEYLCLDRDIFSQVKQSEFMAEILISQILNKAKQGFWNWKRDNPEIPGSMVAPVSDSHASQDRPKSLGLGESEPVFLADDDIAQEILRPTIHHVLKKLDNLLVGLHQARAASTLSKKSTRNLRNEAFTEDDEPTPYKSRGYMTRSRGDGRESWSSNLFTTSAANLASNDQPAHNHLNPPPSSRYSRLLQESKGRGLRGWSEILGIAMMTGWDSKSVNRAAIRCAALFEEGIMLRTLNENEQSVKTNAETVPVGNKGLDSNATTRVPDPRRLKKCFKIFCPVEDCNRSTKGKGFSAMYSFKRHLNQVHKKLNRSVNLPANTVESEDEMYGGVHVDGFLQPVTTKASLQRHGSGSRQSNP